MEEETLDPENWEEMRQLGHQMVDDMLDWLRTVRERPVWRPVPDEVKTHLQQSLSLNSAGGVSILATNLIKRC